MEDNEDNEDDGEMQREQHGGYEDGRVWKMSSFKDQVLGESNLMQKLMVILRDFPFSRALFGLEM